MDCVKSCPVPDTLNFSTGFLFQSLRPRIWTTTALGTVIVLVFCALVYTARVTGCWQTNISPPQFRMRLLMIDSPEVTHPRMNLGK